MNEHEKDASIDYILSQGLVTPQTAQAYIAEIVHTIGFRYIFWDMGYSLFFAAMTLAIVLVLFIITPDEYRYSAAVTVAPLMFLLTTMFAETSERACGLYELKQTCRYTIRQISALRIICYSVAGMAFTAVIAAVNAKNAYEFFCLFPLCLSALIICAVLSLAAMRYLRGKWGCVSVSAVWMLVSIALPFSLGEKWETVLSGIPIVISVILAIIGAAILIYQISRMLSEENQYAVA